jgi:hypothetical protein
MLTFNKNIMDINKVLNNKRLIKAVLGIRKESFEKLLVTFRQILIEETNNNKKRKRRYGGGSNGNIKDPRKKLFFILWYLKVYPTYDVAAYVFSSSKSRTQHWGAEILPLLEKTLGRKLVLPERRISSVEEFFKMFPDAKEVMLDGVERPTVRSRKNKTQNKHYSGKKKRHTRKNLVLANSKRKILLLTPTKHGRVHDKKMSDKNMVASRIPEEVSLLVDTGFQGIQKQHENTLIPKKKPKGGFLTQAEKEMNRLISSSRIVVEHAIGGMKRFGAASHIFRNKNGLDDTFMNVCAGLWNLELETT